MIKLFKIYLGLQILGIIVLTWLSIIGVQAIIAAGIFP